MRTSSKHFSRIPVTSTCYSRNQCWDTISRTREETRTCIRENCFLLLVGSITWPHCKGGFWMVTNLIRINQSLKKNWSLSRKMVSIWCDWQSFQGLQSGSNCWQRKGHRGIRVLCWESTTSKSMLEVVGLDGSFEDIALMMNNRNTQLRSSAIPPLRLMWRLPGKKS